jgi:hypothetical protein
LPGEDAGRQLDREVLDRLALRRGEPANALRGSVDIGLQALVERVRPAGDVLSGHDQGAIPTVERQSVVGDRGLAFGGDPGEHLLHTGRDILGALPESRRSLLDDFDRHAHLCRDQCTEDRRASIPFSFFEQVVQFFFRLPILVDPVSPALQSGFSAAESCGTGSEGNS